MLGRWVDGCHVMSCHVVCPAKLGQSQPDYEAYHLRGQLNGSLYLGDVLLATQKVNEVIGKHVLVTLEEGRHCKFHLPS